jgi:hypothetical protein
MKSTTTSLPRKTRRSMRPPHYFTRAYACAMMRITSRSPGARRSVMPVTRRLMASNLQFS